MAKKKKEWSEDELILTFHLKRHDSSSLLLTDWLDAQQIPMVAYEEALFSTQDQIRVRSCWQRITTNEKGHVMIFRIRQYSILKIERAHRHVPPETKECAC